MEGLRYCIYMLFQYFRKIILPCFAMTHTTGLHTQKAYTHTGTSSPQILLLSAHAYTHEKELGVCIGLRKYLYECTPFGYVNL